MNDEGMSSTDRAIEAVKNEREHQKERWSAAHDLDHLPFEWLGLIASYAAKQQYTEAAALCIAAMEANER